MPEKLNQKHKRQFSSGELHNLGKNKKGAKQSGSGLRDKQPGHTKGSHSFIEGARQDPGIDLRDKHTRKKTKSPLD